MLNHLNKHKKHVVFDCIVVVVYGLQYIHIFF